MSDTWLESNEEAQSVVDTCVVCNGEVFGFIYGTARCRQCGQPYYHDNDCYMIDLSKDQIEVLIKHSEKVKS